MESRLAEKLKQAGSVVARQHKKIEDRADAIIKREADIERKTDDAFKPHESMLDDTEKGLDALERQLAGLSNDPLHTGDNGSQGEKQVITTSDTGGGENVLNGVPTTTAANRQGRPT